MVQAHTPERQEKEGSSNMGTQIVLSWTYQTHRQFISALDTDPTPLANCSLNSALQCFFNRDIIREDCPCAAPLCCFPGSTVLMAEMVPSPSTRPTNSEPAGRKKRNDCLRPQHHPKRQSWGQEGIPPAPDWPGPLWFSPLLTAWSMACFLGRRCSTILAQLLVLWRPSRW